MFQRGSRRDTNNNVDVVATLRLRLTISTPLGRLSWRGVPTSTYFAVIFLSSTFHRIIPERSRCLYTYCKLQTPYYRCNVEHQRHFARCHHQQSHTPSVSFKLICTVNRQRRRGVSCISSGGFEIKDILTLAVIFHFRTLSNVFCV